LRGHWIMLNWFFDSARRQSNLRRFKLQRPWISIIWVGSARVARRRAVKSGRINIAFDLFRRLDLLQFEAHLFVLLLERLHQLILLGNLPESFILFLQLIQSGGDILGRALFLYLEQFFQVHDFFLKFVYDVVVLGAEFVFLNDLHHGVGSVREFKSGDRLVDAVHGGR